MENLDTGQILVLYILELELLLDINFIKVCLTNFEGVTAISYRSHRKDWKSGREGGGQAAILSI